MLRSMYSGISGLKNFQTKLDVIGNNIANVNTYGFKKGRVVFKDLISQTTAGASDSTATRGGVNPKQVGLGSQIAAIDTIHGTGALQTTSRTLDLAISGDGFFMVGDNTGAAPASAQSEVGNVKYTRAGNFYMDAEGYLVDSEGRYLAGEKSRTGTAPNVQVATERIQVPTDAQSMSIGQDGTVSYVDAAGTLQPAGKLVLAKFPNTGGLEKVGSNYYQASSNSGNPLFGSATESGIGSVQSGFLEMSNVDLSEEFTDMIVTQRGFQANSRIITTSDEILQELVNLKR
ncbi:flagellar basal body rod protein FlgG [Lysinibacillus sp. SGAir0095]|uniref:flagellar basal body rod protein FlgG n=1 Tax=Lysinibacillus sp. SGAir0095 TaxID=2070463 RepID=UPI0010CCCA7A|nr:flagellar basal body rod protein FlgG [Lysinibacillus sp. SGAir0095]QCR31803.1 flagellar basal body rod protein FlgG [Lysinibacillus sp. SGAir0095]